MATLDAEIAKLERMLENHSSSTTSSQISVIPHIKVGLSLAILNKRLMEFCFVCVFCVFPQPEIIIDGDFEDKQAKSSRPSISSTLPLLLLSVLPPLIPRSEMFLLNFIFKSSPKRRSLTFRMFAELRGPTQTTCPYRCGGPSVSAPSRRLSANMERKFRQLTCSTSASRISATRNEVASSIGLRASSALGRPAEKLQRPH